MYDFIVIGAGVIGSFIAQELSKYQIKVLVLDKENDIANKTSAANSAIIHSGYDPLPGSLKATLNAKGNNMYPGICHYYNVPFKKTGSLTLAFDDGGVEHLKKLAKRAEVNGVTVELLEQDKILKMEPHVKDNVKLGLFAPSAGIVYPWQISFALMDHAISNGVKLQLNQEVKEIVSTANGYIVRSQDTTYNTRQIINCSGVHGTKLQALIEEVDYEITPRKGEYYVLARGAFKYVNHIIFPLPTARGKGVLAVPISEREILIGPTSDYVSDYDDVSTSASNLAYLQKEILHTMNEMPTHRIIRSFAGLRATSQKHDFDIFESKTNKGLFHVLGIESPGLASAPAIAKYVARIINVEKYTLKVDFKEYCSSTRICELSAEERIKKIFENGKYGKIVCRCEKISQQEVIEAIGGNVGSATIKGIKKRVRPGSGACQGGFCEANILQIIAKETNCNELDVNYDSINSKVLLSRSKEGY